MDMTQYWSPELETISREDLQALQLKRLRETVAQASKSVYYGKLFKELNITPDSIKTLDDLRRIPFTTKEQLRTTYPFGALASPKSDVVRLHSSSGTTGTPTVICHTKKDLENWADRVARSLYSVGVRNTDVFQNSSGYGMFTGGLGFQYGAERLGCLTVPAAAGNTKRQIKFITDFGTSVIHAVPSYALRLAEVFKEMGIDPAKDTSLRIFAIGAEPHTEEQRRRVEQMLGVKAYNSFGMSEMSGPGVAFECPEQNGMHLWEDHFIMEIVDPDTLEPVPEGELGELVLTTLTREAMPLIRYRTRDLTRVLPGPCPCGRTHRRIDRMKGRTDDMFIVKGVNIFPMQIENVLLKYAEVGNNYLITINPKVGGDEIVIELELRGDLFTDDYGQLEQLNKRITSRLRDEILVTPVVKFLQPGALPQSEGKAVRVKDLRKLC